MGALQGVTGIEGVAEERQCDAWRIKRPWEWFCVWTGGSSGQGRLTSCSDGMQYSQCKLTLMLMPMPCRRAVMMMMMMMRMVVVMAVVMQVLGRNDEKSGPCACRLQRAQVQQE